MFSIIKTVSDENSHMLASLAVSMLHQSFADRALDKRDYLVIIMDNFVNLA